MLEQSLNKLLSSGIKPKQTEYQIIEKLDKLHNEWNGVLKHQGKSSNEANDNEFISTLDDLFEVAHVNVLSDVKNFQTNFFFKATKT